MMANHCRDCPADIVQPGSNLTAGDLIWGDTKDGERRVLLEVKPHLIYCKGRSGKPKPEKRVEPKLSPSRLAVLAGLIEIKYPKGEAYEIARDAKGDDFTSQWKSATAKRAAEITS